MTRSYLQSNQPSGEHPAIANDSTSFGRRTLIGSTPMQLKASGQPPSIGTPLHFGSGNGDPGARSERNLIGHQICLPERSGQASAPKNDTGVAEGRAGEAEMFASMSTCGESAPWSGGPFSSGAGAAP